jgi:hypothetical protein
MVEIWAERAKPISFSSKVLNIHIVWTMDERPIGPLTGVISVHFCGFKLMVGDLGIERKREGQAHLILQQCFKHTCCLVHGR